MKRLTLTLLLLAAPAIAQPAPPTASGQQAWQMMYEQQSATYHDTIAAALDLRGQVAALTKQVADLTAENVKLKAPAAKPADAAPPAAPEQATPTR